MQACLYSNESGRKTRVPISTHSSLTLKQGGAFSFAGSSVAKAESRNSRSIQPDSCRDKISLLSALPASQHPPFPVAQKRLLAFNGEVQTIPTSQSQTEYCSITLPWSKPYPLTGPVNRRVRKSQIAAVSMTANRCQQDRSARAIQQAYSPCQLSTEQQRNPRFSPIVLKPVP